VSPDGTRLASFGSRQAELWDVNAGRVLRTLVEQSGTVMSAAFSPDGKRLATGSTDGSVQEWNSADGTPLQSFPKHDERVVYVGFSPDGRFLATAEDYSQRIYCDPPSPEQELRQRAGQDISPPVVFSPGGSLFAHTSIPGYNVARVFDRDGREIARLPQNLRGSPIIYEVKTLRRLPSPQAQPRMAAFASDSEFLTLDFQKLQAWQIEPTALSSVLPLMPGSRGACLSPDGQTAAIAYPNRLELIGIKDGAHRQLPLRVVATGNGRVLAINAAVEPGLYGHQLAQWPSGRRLDIGAQMAFQIGGAFAWSPDGRFLLVTRPDDRTALVLDLKDGVERNFGQDQTPAALAQDWRFVATAGASGDATVWDRASAQSVCRFADQDGKVTAASFSDKDNALALGYADGAIRILEIPSCRERHAEAGNGAAVTRVLF
jgi:WD40 repeat protein